MSEKGVQNRVREKYGPAAKQVAAGGRACCGGGAELCGCDPISRDRYGASESSGVPAEAVAASLGCGNPTALAQLRPGEIVLDLGSGGGIDVLLSARRVAPTGKAYGVDMTDEMLELARENQKKSGVANAEFLKGTIENIPLPDNAVDVIISNCVINLSGDKDRVMREAFRVLKPWGEACGCRRSDSRRNSSASQKEHGTVGRLHCGCARGEGIPGKARPRLS